MTNLTLRISSGAFLMLLALLPASLRAGSFPVAVSPEIEFGGGAAFDGTNYLVAMTAGTDVVGQRLSASSQLVGLPAVVGSNPGFPPAVAMAAAKTQCLVAWSDLSIESGITMFGRLVSPNQGPTGSTVPLLASVGSHGPQLVQAAASDGTNFLVVWQDAASADVYGQFVTASGSTAGGEFVLFTVSEDVGERNLTVAFGRTNYLVAWQDGSNNSNNSYCRVVSAAGVVGSIVQINTVASLAQNPMAAAFDGTNYLVVWSRALAHGGSGEPLWELCGRFVAPDGTAEGDELVLVTEQSSFPALAFDGDNYLLAWGYNTTSTNADISIHARFLDRDAAPCGPIFTPFSTQGTNPPLLPLNGLLFDGDQYLLTATFGRFMMDEVGDVIGFSGGDVYGTFVPRSTTRPVFQSARIVEGQFQGLLSVVPGQTYTIETSTNLLAWDPVGTVSSEGTNRIVLTDDRGLANSNRLFYRAVRGNRIGPTYELSFMEFANGGGFGGGFTPTPSYPVTLQHYSAVFDVDDAAALPAATNVFFTGPQGSGLLNTPAAADYSNVDDAKAFYQSPYVSSPSAAPGGVWTVNFKGADRMFDVADPQAASRLVVPLPTVSVSGDAVQSVSWVYCNAVTGAALGGAPSYVTGIQVQIEGHTGGRIYNSPTLSAASLAHTLTSAVSWSNVQMMHMAYDDSLGNHYVVSFQKP